MKLSRTLLNEKKNYTWHRVSVCVCVWGGGGGWGGGIITKTLKFNYKTKLRKNLIVQVPIKIFKNLTTKNQSTFSKFSKLVFKLRSGRDAW